MFEEGFRELQNRKVDMEELARQEVRKRINCADSHAIYFSSMYFKTLWVFSLSFLLFILK